MAHGNTVVETPRLAECVGEVRLLLRQILSESSRYCVTKKDSTTSCEVLREKILDECHSTFTACFHAFYPTNNLKWSCLCELLALSDPVSTVVARFTFGQITYLLVSLSDVG